MSCPPPRMLISENGLEVTTHCDLCLPAALRIAEQLRARTQPASGPPRPPAQARTQPWYTKDLVAIIFQHCKGTGRTYEWLIAKITNGAVTPADPVAFRKALDRLYSRRLKLAAIIEDVHGYAWTREWDSKLRNDDRPSPFLRVVLLPKLEAAA